MKHTHKLVSVLLFCSLCLCLSGCVSSTQYKELEKRVSDLEKLHGIVSEEKNGGKEAKISGDNSNEYNYTLTDFTADEVVKECISNIDNLPYIGQSYEDYKNSLRVSPLMDVFQEEKGMVFNYRTNIKEFPHEDILSQIWINNIYPQMDGSIGGSDAETKVTLSITEYDKASQIYDGLYTHYFSNIDDKARPVDKREGSYWTAYVNSANYHAQLSMKKNEDLFLITISIRSTLK